MGTRVIAICSIYDMPINLVVDCKCDNVRGQLVLDRRSSKK
jgi:hypothetical protein